MMLPTPLVITGIGTALLLGAAAVFWFLHLIRPAVYMAVAGCVLLGAAGVAYGYERMGEAKIKPVLLACQTDLGTVKEANQQLQDSVTNIRREVADANTKIAALSAATQTAQGQAIAIRKQGEAKIATLKQEIVVYEGILASAANAPKTPEEAVSMLSQVDTILSGLVGP